MLSSTLGITDYFPMQSLVFSISQFKYQFDTVDFIISLKPNILQEWGSHLKKSYCFERHQFIFLPIIYPWKYGSFLEITCGEISKVPAFCFLPSFLPPFLPSLFPTFLPSFLLFFHFFPVNLHITPNSPKVLYALQLSFISSQSQWFTNENIPA